MLAGCSKDWWTRGQPPSVDTLVSRSHLELIELRKQNKNTRETVAKASTRIEQALLKAFEISKNGGNNSQSKQYLEAATTSFIALEGKLSIGSRAAYGELAGQLRNFVGSKTTPSPEAIGLFSARMFFFLGNELTVPKPSFG